MQHCAVLFFRPTATVTLNDVVTNPFAFSLSDNSIVDTYLMTLIVWSLVEDSVLKSCLLQHPTSWVQSSFGLAMMLFKTMF